MDASGQADAPTNTPPTPPQGFREATPNDLEILKECECIHILGHAYGEYNPYIMLTIGIFLPCIGFPNLYFTCFQQSKVAAFNNGEIDQVTFGKVSVLRENGTVFAKGLSVDAQPRPKKEQVD